MKMIERIINRTCIAFSIFILFICILGYILQEDAVYMAELSTLFSIDQSIRYSTIIQGLSVSFCISIFNEWIGESKRGKRMLLKWNIILRFICSVVITIFSIIVFRWFPLDLASAWIGFFISFTCCTSISIFYMLYKTKKENEEYQILFEEYKKNHQRKE